MTNKDWYRPLQPPYPNKFQAGDIAISRWYIEFMDGTKHIIGQKIKVTEHSKSYYNVHHHVYDKVV